MSYSYSRLATFDQCPYKYKLVYVDGNYIKSPGVATEFGSLIHSIEESIGNAIKEQIPIDYDKCLSNLYTGVEGIKKSFPDDYYNPDKIGRTYDGKYNFYKRKGLHRLENRLKLNPDIEIISCEEEFFVDYKGLTFHGFIDRLMKQGDTYIIEDVKTYTKPLDRSGLQAPLQFVIYALAIQDKYKTKNIKCSYDLPLCDEVQEVNINFMNKGLKQLDKLIEKLNTSKFEPKPSPLCHWCVFGGTYPNQPEEAKGLCPYYSLWTRQNKTRQCHKGWLGQEGHEWVMKEFREELGIKKN